jgi:hypothetical protein
MSETRKIAAILVSDVVGYSRLTGADKDRTMRSGMSASSQVGTMTYYVALAFEKAEDDGGDIVACDPKQARSSDQAIRMSGSLAKAAGHCGDQARPSWSRPTGNHPARSSA